MEEKKARTLLVRVEGCHVALFELKLGDVGLGPGFVPSLGESEGFACECCVVDHLYGKLKAFAVQPFLRQSPSAISHTIKGSQARESTHIPLDAIEHFYLLLAPMLPPILVQMLLPLLRRDALPDECVHIVVDVRQELLKPTEKPLEVQDEVCALLVRHGAVCVVWVLARLEVDNEPLVFWVRSVLLERVGECFGADEEGETSVGGGVEELEEDALDVGRPAFIEPEVRRVGLAVGERKESD